MLTHLQVIDKRPGTPTAAAGPAGGSQTPVPPAVAEASSQDGSQGALIRTRMIVIGEVVNATAGKPEHISEDDISAFDDADADEDEDALSANELDLVLLKLLENLHAVPDSRLVALHPPVATPIRAPRPATTGSPAIHSGAAAK